MRKLLLIPIFLLFIFAYSCERDGDSLGSDENTEGTTDSFEGDFTELTLSEQLELFEASRFTCVISAPDGSIITREGDHLREDDLSYLTLEKGLASGTYRFLALRYEIESETKSDSVAEYLYDEFGLGFRIEVAESGIFSVLDSYDSSIGLNGSGTETDPYVITSYDHLIKLRSYVNTERTNEALTGDTVFSQQADLVLDYASWKSDNNCGWSAIGSMSNCPFMGQYKGNDHTIEGMWIERGDSSGIGLFGFIQNAQISNVHMINSEVIGHFAVGALVGCVTTPGDVSYTSMITDCTVNGGTIDGTDGGIGVGSVVGFVDMYSKAFLSNCTNEDAAVSGTYAVGGLLGGGAMTSAVTIDNSTNSANVTSSNTGAGGLVGTLDTLTVTSSANYGVIVGSTRKTNSDSEGCYGTGGIAGGTGFAQIYATTNSGSVSGYVGVGGIIGSSRMGGDDLMYNNVLVKTAHNTGSITGESSVGGICGEAQFGGYALLNEGSITATGESNSHVGGICGLSALAVIYNAVNGGDVTSNCTSGGTAAGIVSKSDWGSFLTCQNMGNVTSNAEHSAGIVGLSGNYTIMNMCSNAGAIVNTNSEGYVAGIIGELGDQREWSDENICAVFFGAMDIFLAGAGFALAGIGLRELSASAEHVVHVLHLTELATGSIPVIAETVLLGLGCDEMLNEGEADLMETEMSTTLDEKDDEIKDILKNYRANFNASSSYFQTGINSSAHTNFTTQVESLNAYIEANDYTNDEINDNMNLKREERLEDIESQVHTQEVWQKVVSGICIAVITAASITSAVATGGLATAASFTVAAASLGSGINSIVEGATDYTENVAIVSQCANYGPITTSTKKTLGGIVAEAHDNCWIKDCVNTASNLSSDSNKVSSIVGSTGNKVDIDRCLAMGEGWDDSRPSSSSVIYLAESGTSKGNYVYSTVDLMNIEIYEDLDWDIASISNLFREAIWTLDDSGNVEGAIPVPYTSEMRDVMNE